MAEHSCFFQVTLPCPPPAVTESWVHHGGLERREKVMVQVVSYTPWGASASPPLRRHLRACFCLPCSPAPGQHLLDVATGTGRPRKPLSSRRFDGSVVARDICPAMLEVARRKLHKTSVAFSMPTPCRMRTSPSMP
jgi:2-polyprenyl-3-methyl-5-hydroxy-6-metoxy-1,4-benzoquinol methylase